MMPSLFECKEISMHVGSLISILLGIWLLIKINSSNKQIKYDNRILIFFVSFIFICNGLGFLVYNIRPLTENINVYGNFQEDFFNIAHISILFFTIYYFIFYNRHLFSLTLRYKQYFEKDGEINITLIKAFKLNDQLLSHKANVIKINKKMWEIKKNGIRLYKIRDIGNQLKIYAEHKDNKILKKGYIYSFFLVCLIFSLIFILLSEEAKNVIHPHFYHFVIFIFTILFCIKWYQMRDDNEKRQSCTLLFIAFVIHEVARKPIFNYFTPKIFNEEGFYIGLFFHIDLIAYFMLFLFVIVYTFFIDKTRNNKDKYCELIVFIISLLFFTLKNFLPEDYGDIVYDSTWTFFRPLLIILGILFTGLFGLKYSRIIIWYIIGIAILEMSITVIEVIAIDMLSMDYTHLMSVIFALLSTFLSYRLNCFRKTKTEGKEINEELKNREIFKYSILFLCYFLIAGIFSICLGFKYIPYLSAAFVIGFGPILNQILNKAGFDRK